MSTNEVRRIKTAYDQYAKTAASQTRWKLENAGNRMILLERWNRLVSGLSRAGFLPLEGRRILEIGCGDGAILESLKNLGAREENLYGMDLLEEKIQAARLRLPRSTFFCENAEHIPFADACFDLVFVFTAFSSILDKTMRRAISDEIMRVAKRDSCLVWYDLRVNNPRNPSVSKINLSEFNELFRFPSGSIRPITVCPPLARVLGPTARFMYPLLSKVPFLLTHNLAVVLLNKNPIGTDMKVDGRLSNSQ